MAITRHVKRAGKLYIRIFPDKPITKKPAETRMGNGKGGAEDWVAVVRPGRVMYEIEGVTEELAREAFHLADHKLPVQTRVSSHGSRCYERPAAPRTCRGDRSGEELRGRSREAAKTSCSSSSSKQLHQPAREHDADPQRRAATSRGSTTVLRERASAGRRGARRAEAMSASHRREAAADAAKTATRAAKTRKRKLHRRRRHVDKMDKTVVVAGRAPRLATASTTSS